MKSPSKQEERRRRGKRAGPAVASAPVRAASSSAEAPRRSRSIALVRRGVRHGRFTPSTVKVASALDAPDFAAACEVLWREDRPIVLPGALKREVLLHARSIAASRALFERLRRGADFQDAVARRTGAGKRFVPAGATIDTVDAREIVKVFVDGRQNGRTAARDLYAKLSWIAHDERDLSLRIRFSFGAEALLDWQTETRRAPWSDRFAAALFPECAAITANRPLVRLIERLAGRRARFSERIVYSNSPGGGAKFHHDDEEHQLGVVFGQLAGETAWLALRKRELAQHVAASARAPALKSRARTPHRALRALDRDDDRALERLLNRTPSFTRRLAAHGALFHLRPGDALLLPTHGPDDTCWHSVFALGARASLAHSYGIFPVNRGSSRKS